MGEFLWYIPNTVEAGVRGDDVASGWADLEQIGHAGADDRGSRVGRRAVRHQLGAAGHVHRRHRDRGQDHDLPAADRDQARVLAARPTSPAPPRRSTTSPAGRVLVNIVSGHDNLAAYGDREGDRSARYGRTREFLQIVRALWTQENVTYRGDHFQVEGSTVVPKPHGAELGRHPRLYFGGASAEAEAVAATEADVQLFWGEPLDDIAARIDRLRALTGKLGRAHAPLEFGLRITTVVRETSDEAWRDARARVDAMADGAGVPTIGGVHRAGAAGGGPRFANAVGQQRLLDLADRAEVLDSCLYTAPGRVGGGGAATTWLVGAYDEVAAALRKYADLGITHFIISDAPYLRECARIGDELLPRLRSSLTPS